MKGTTMNVKWLDNQDDNYNYLITINFNDGSLGYLKNENYEKISEYYTELWNTCDHIVGMTLEHKDGRAIATKYRGAA
jgi:hypothetical protein